MRILIWGKTFVKSFRLFSKKHPDLIRDAERTLKLLVEAPFAPQLETHKLKGKLSGSWACKVGYDLRIIFDFICINARLPDPIPYTAFKRIEGLRYENWLKE